MSQTPDTYGKTVCSFLRRATSWEKADIQAELDAHVSDHTAALLEAGYAPDHAQRLAEEAMGDPAEVGKALDQEFSRGWLIVSRLALAALTLFLLWAVFYLLLSADSVFVSLQARIDPLHSSHHDQTYAEETLYPLDLSFSFPNGDVLSLYALHLAPDGDTYTLRLHTVTYNKNPLRAPYYGVHSSFTFSLDSPPGEPLSFSGGGSGSNGNMYRHIDLSPLEEGAVLTVHVDSLDAEAEIPLPWEEVAQP